MTPRFPAVLVLLIATSALAQTADLTLKASAAPVFNAGDPDTIRVTVTNLGPDKAETAGVRLPKLSDRAVIAAQSYGCFDLLDSVLCTGGALEAGKSRDFVVPFVPPDVAGPIVLSPRTESFTIDPDHSNDSAPVTANVVAMADLATRVNVYPGLQPGKVSNVAVVVTNHAARNATDVRATVTIPVGFDVVTTPSSCSRASNSLTCAVGDVGRNSYESSFGFTVRPQPGAPDQVTFVAEASSNTEEWNASDNVAIISQGVYAVPDLDVTVSVPPQQDESGSAPVHVELLNGAVDVAAVNATVTMSVGSYEQVVSWNAPGWSCQALAVNQLRCSIAAIAPQSSTGIDLNVKFHARAVRSPVTVVVTQAPGPNFPPTYQPYSREAVFYRSFEVLNTADSGSGSLREAITNVNAQCSAEAATPCSVVFRIPPPVPSEGWFTIEPRSPLPEITATDFMIDGESQTAWTGDTNRRGPEIELRGDSAGEAEGLRLVCAIGNVRGLAIGGFALNGIKAVPRPSTYYSGSRVGIENNYLGVDPTGTAAVPNHLRGFMGYRVSGAISKNVISGNLRSGIWVEEADSLTISDNRIGVAALDQSPLPNGATGVFINNSAPFYDITVQHNVIEYNQEFGVSSTKRARFSLLDNVVLHNRIAADLGLDGPTSDYSNGFIAAPPLITSARYDAASGNTIIEGKVPAPTSYFGYSSITTVYLYANSTAEEGSEQFLATADTIPGGSFAVTVPLDLRRKFIDATTLMVIDYGEITPRLSSEFGPPVGVTD